MKNSESKPGPLRHISVSIEAPPERVYEYAANPANLPSWAEGLSGSVENSAGVWIAHSPMGQVKIKFAPANALGVMDHDVTVPSGQTFHNPMRVLPNRSGSEVVFTLYRHPGMTDDEFERDARQIEVDLRRLKDILEKSN